MMKQHIIRSAAGLLTVLSLTITGCSKFLDVNDNPNKTETADPSLVLPSAQAAVGHVLGNHYQIYGGIWGQYWTQSRSSSQYKIIDQYAVSGSNFDRPWQILYADGMEDMQIIIDQGGANKYKQYAAICLI
jgi:hypothetical protein